MKHIKKLNDLYFEWQKKQYPSVPVSAIPIKKFSDKNANELEKSIVVWIKLNGYQAERIKNSGRYIDTRKTYKDVLGASRTVGSGKYIKGTGTNGTSDISATILGRSVKIEVKIGKDRQSDEQIKYQRSIESAGGEYWIVKTFDDFYEKYINFINLIIK